VIEYCLKLDINCPECGTYQDDQVRLQIPTEVMFRGIGGSYPTKQIVDWDNGIAYMCCGCEIIYPLFAAYMNAYTTKLVELGFYDL
jgi:hypothetical protein